MTIGRVCPADTTPLVPTVSSLVSFAPLPPAEPSGYPSEPLPPTATTRNVDAPAGTTKVPFEVYVHVKFTPFWLHSEPRAAAAGDTPTDDAAAAAKAPTKATGALQDGRELLKVFRTAGPSDRAPTHQGM